MFYCYIYVKYWVRTDVFVQFETSQQGQKIKAYLFGHRLLSKVTTSHALLVNEMAARCSLVPLGLRREITQTHVR